MFTKEKITMRPIRSRRRAGFTLIELLVVIAIIAVLVSLLLPAVQKVREASNRAACQNNLHQLALGLLNFEGANKHLPSSQNVGAGKPRQGWTTFVLPYLDQGVLGQQWDFTTNWYDFTPATGPTGNAAIALNPLKVFECPAAPQGRLDSRPDPGLWGSVFVATSDYGATTHVAARLVTAGLVDVAGPGVMPKNSTPHLADVTDGVSNTILLAESAGRPQLWHVGQQFSAPPTDRVNGGGWARAATDFSIEGSSFDGTVVPGPCAVNCTNGDDTVTYPDPYYGTNGSGAIYAFHASGANVAMADGSVQFLGKNIDIRVLARLVTRAGGETVTANDF
jgi:prepilin-type N-terminal cleavage/methylation domain-containing protein/prepilin-type processing-associated H-X9-DG protein